MVGPSVRNQTNLAAYEKAVISKVKTKPHK